MREIIIDSNCNFIQSATTKGNQIKWSNGIEYIKADTFGYEGISEFISTIFQKHIINGYDFVKYELCKIKESNRKSYNGCYSLSCLNEGESMVSLWKILNTYDNNFDTFQRKCTEKVKLINYIIDVVYKITDLNIFDYLSYIFKLDAILLNGDRHYNNINLILMSDYKFRFSPIFDNGDSLLSDLRMFPMHSSDIISMTKNVKSRPICTTFKNPLKWFVVK